MGQRTERIDELLRQEIGAILAREVQDPRIGFATITDVETAPDLGHARVWVSVIGQQGERTATIAALEHAMPFVRRELGRRLRLRRIPELHVRLDDTVERGTRVLQLLHELEQGRTPDESATELESLPTPVARLPHEGDSPVEPAVPGEPATPGEPAAQVAPEGPAGTITPAQSSGRRRKAPGRGRRQGAASDRSRRPRR